MSPALHDRDWRLSPRTGLTRRHWVGIAHGLLDGVFRHGAGPDEPLSLPRHEHAITYPQPGDPPWRARSAHMEAVARTLLVAAPLLAHDPELRLRGRGVRDYYARALLALADPSSERYVGDRDAMVRVSGDRHFQITCEAASLVLGLTVARAALWERYTPAERDRLAALLSTWGHARTLPHNWRLFNIHVLSFLQREGYAIDEDLLLGHLRAIRAFDSGDGWYRDGNTFDYYSSWAFQFYAPLWVAWSGRHTHPAIAREFEASLHALLRHYGRCFDREGRQCMWGRSNIYRFAASAPFGSAFFLERPGIAPGLARGVLSANLLQFAAHPRFLADGVPALGFYGAFAPLIQPYSCAASPFWFGNSFQALALPPAHPFWTAREEHGPWDDVPPDGVRETALRGPGLVVTQYGRSGASELRTAKVMVPREGAAQPHYSRLAFHTRFPWQSDTPTGLSAMHYTLRTGQGRLQPNLILDGGVRGGVLYRRLVFDFAGTFSDRAAIDLADFAVPEGLVRCDRLRLDLRETTVDLSHYALPVPEDADWSDETRTLPDGRSARLLAAGDRQLAALALQGWEEFAVTPATGLHPESDRSVLLTLHSAPSSCAAASPWRIAALLHRTTAGAWTDDDLQPIRDCTPTAEGAVFTLRDGSTRIVDFSGMEGTLSL